MKCNEALAYRYPDVNYPVKYTCRWKGRRDFKEKSDKKIVGKKRTQHARLHSFSRRAFSTAFPQLCTSLIEEPAHLSQHKAKPELQSVSVHLCSLLCPP